MVVITGYYANLTRSVKLKTMARVTEVLFVATSDRLPSHPRKDGRATDSCDPLTPEEARAYPTCILYQIIGNVHERSSRPAFVAITLLPSLRCAPIPTV